MAVLHGTETFEHGASFGGQCFKSGLLFRPHKGANAQLLGLREFFHEGDLILIPKKDSRTGRQRLGHVSRQGSALLRFLLVEAAQAAVRPDPDWKPSLH